MNDDQIIEEQARIDNEMFAGKTLASVVKQGEGVKYEFEGGSSFWHRSHIPVNEHKLALLEKALDMCSGAYNQCLGGTYQPSSATDWVGWAERDISTPDKWGLSEPIVYPKWIVEREEKPDGFE